MFSTGAELWREWERTGALRPQHYDRDVADRVRAALGSPLSNDLTVAELLAAKAWSPRDLIHALAPLVNSFVGMMRDLLALLNRVGATAGTGENLRLVYEFAEGDVIDESLANLRETVQRVENVMAMMPSLTFRRDHAWSSPIRNAGSLAHAAALLGVDDGDLAHWRFANGLPSPAPTGRVRVDEVVQRYVNVLHAVLDRLALRGDDVAEVGDWLRATRHDREANDIDLAEAATDFWVLSEVAAVHRFVDEVRGGSRVADEILDGIQGWLAGFQSDVYEATMVECLVEELTDVLSLPAWGRRHELYSAWVASQIDQALERSRLEFVVTDGALRFPFRPTLLARLDPPSGPSTPSGGIEFWCEVRSSATAPLGEGRKGGIQPDYRFIRTNAEGSETVAAIEVKQYLRPANKNPGEALRDYVVGLPSATVLLVAHGPLGARVLDRVPASERHRALVHAHVRVGRPRESAAFRDDIARLFPPAVEAPLTRIESAAFRDDTTMFAPAVEAPVTRLELRWRRSTGDLDLHVLGPDGEETSWQSTSTRHSSLREDAFDGGPEIVDLAAPRSGPLHVWVHLFSKDAASVRHAGPEVSFVRADGSPLVLVPRTDAPVDEARRWYVGEIDAHGRVLVSPSSRSRNDASPRQPERCHDG